MPSKRDVLSLLSREELISVVEKFGLEVADRRKKDGLLEAVAASKKATLADVLPELGRERLKELRAGLGLADGGREKAVLIERLVPEQEAISLALASVTDRIVVERAQAACLHAVKYALMSVLLTGEVRVCVDEVSAA